MEYGNVYCIGLNAPSFFYSIGKRTSAGHLWRSNFQNIFISLLCFRLSSIFWLYLSIARTRRSRNRGRCGVWRNRGSAVPAPSAALKTVDRVRNVFPETWLLSNASVGFAQCSSFDAQLNVRQHNYIGK